MKLFCVVVLAAFLSGAGAGESAAQDKFRVASGGFSTAVHAVVWAAYEKKIFQKYGLEGEYLALESGTPAMQALLANELQIVFTTGALAITANLQGADTTIIAVREDVAPPIIEKILCQNPRRLYGLDRS